jgi:hypothetical protein
MLTLAQEKKAREELAQFEQRIQHDLMVTLAKLGHGPKLDDLDAMAIVDCSQFTRRVSFDIRYHNVTADTYEAATAAMWCLQLLGLENTTTMASLILLQLPPAGRG